MTVIDAHHHFWDPDRRDYPWLTDELAAIRRPFEAGDLAPLLEAGGVDRTILVQTLASVDETRDFLGLTQRTPFIAGVVGWVDLQKSDVADAIAVARGQPGGTSLVGIRHQVHDEPDPKWLLLPAVRRGLREVESAGLTYDLLVRARELPAAVETVSALPNLRFVVDHAAKPPIASGGLEPWRSQLRLLGPMPNVWCKLSGLVTEADWEAWTVDDLRPYVDELLEIFGPDRLMFGSDWPVALVASSYGRWVSTVHELIADLSPTERVDILGGTAQRAYPLPQAS